MLGPRETRELLARHGLRPRTSIGQHFVTDANTVRRIVEISGVEAGDQVLEIGPGLGALSLALLSAGVRLIPVEKDRMLAPVLEEVGVPGVVFADAMQVDYHALLGAVPTVMVANLPYQIATPLLVDLLVGVPQIRSYTVMVQKEVGERLAAAPGTTAYGGVSVKIAYLAEASIPMRVSRRVFYPMPDVESVVVRLDRRDAAPVLGAREKIFRVVEAGFGQRRKTVRRALRGGGWNASDVEAALSTAGVDGQARAEVLSLEQFAALARALP
jgi:16S rRNA (adenine1518-N6/adenine1519-N6)-dimethyltransferase